MSSSSFKFPGGMQCGSTTRTMSILYPNSSQMLWELFSGWTKVPTWTIFLCNSQCQLWQTSTWIVGCLTKFGFDCKDSRFKLWSYSLLVELWNPSVLPFDQVWDLDLRCCCNYHAHFEADDWNLSTFWQSHQGGVSNSKYGDIKPHKQAGQGKSVILVLQWPCLSWVQHVVID